MGTRHATTAKLSKSRCTTLGSFLASKFLITTVRQYRSNRKLEKLGRRSELFGARIIRWSRMNKFTIL
ncbi:unnamed protein product [Lathyrus sativus]|nr:unnamed protein product [Lathyrus sativus]